jgi:hypothetical protein
MPQTTYLPVYTADYPILAKAQKPGGVTVLSAVGAGDVPNKPTFTAGTIQMVSLDAAPEAEEAKVTTQEEVEEEPVDEVEDEDGDGDDGPARRTTKRTTTRTTTRRR